MNISFWKRKPAVGTNFQKLYQNRKIDNIPLLKQNILGVVSVLLFSAFSFCLSQILFFPNPSLTLLVVFGTSLILGLIFLFFMLFVLRTKELLIWISFILAGIAAPFYKSFAIINLVTFCGLIMSMLLLFYGSYQIHREAENYIKFSWKKFVKAGANYIVFGILLFLMLIFYQTYLLETKTQNTSLTDYSFFILEKTSSFIPYFSLNTTVDDLLTKTTQNPAIQSYFGSSGLMGLVDVNSMARDNLGKIINQNLTGKETLLTLLKNYISNITNPTIKGLILGILLISIFSLLNLTFFALNLITVPIGWIILKILLWTKFFNYKTLSVEQQTLSIE